MRTDGLLEVLLWLDCHAFASRTPKGIALSLPLPICQTFTSRVSSQRFILSLCDTRQAFAEHAPIAGRMQIAAGNSSSGIGRTGAVPPYWRSFLPLVVSSERVAFGRRGQHPSLRIADFSFVAHQARLSDTRPSVCRSLIRDR